MKKILILMCVAIMLLLCSCKYEYEFGETTTDLNKSNFYSEYSEYDLDSSYEDDSTKISLNKTSISASSGAVSVEKCVATITKEGTYIVEGTLNNGSIVVDCDKSEKVKLVLNGVDITSKDSAPINVKSADKVVLTLAAGTKNTLTDTYRPRYINSTDPSACLYSSDDLTVNGNGSLVVNGNYNNGIGCKNDLKIISGNVSVTSAKNGLKGKGSVCIKDGTIVINAVKDGILSDVETIPDKGFIYIDGGKIEITAGDDALQAVNNVTVGGGSVTVTVGKGKSVNSFGSQNVKSDLITENK